MQLQLQNLQLCLYICTVKTNYQNSNNKLPFKTVIKDIYQTRGIIGFYKASIPSVSGQIISTASKYTIYNYLNQKNNSHWICKYANGILSGCISTLVTHPFDYVKVNMQMNEKTKIIFKQIASNPLGTLYRGYSKSFIKACISGPLFFPLSDYFSNKFGNVVYGSLTASVIATTIMQPIDYLKTRQIYGNSLNGWKLAKCFRGLHLNLMRVVPHFVIVMTVIDWLKPKI